MQNLATLYHLYCLQSFGEEFCDDFTPTISQPQKQEQNLGHNPMGAKIGFITQTPLLDQNNHFLSKKSAKMLENIIHNVFKLQQQEYCIFSFFKNYTSTPITQEEFSKYQQILQAQILQSPAKIFIIFGAEEIAHPLLNVSHPMGTFFNFKGKELLITHPFKALIQLEALKKQTFVHLKTAKALLENTKES